MRRLFGKQLWLLTLFFAMSMLHAASNNGTQTADFKVEDANKRFDQIALKLSTQNLNVQTLNQAINELSGLTKQAEQCVKETTQQLNDLEDQIKQFFGDAKKLSQRVDASYLKSQQQAVSKKQAECRLFSIRAQEAIEAYRDTALEMQQEITFTRGKTIIERLQTLPNDWAKIKWPSLKTSLSFQMTSLLYVLALFPVALLISSRLQRLMYKKYRPHYFYLIVNTLLSWFALGLIVQMILTDVPFVQPMQNELYDASLSVGLLFITSILIFYNLFLLKPMALLLSWYGLNRAFIRRLGLIIISIYFIRKLGMYGIQMMNGSENLVMLYDELILLVSLILLACFFWILYHDSHRRFNGTVLFEILLVIIITLLTLDFIGYYVLALNAGYVLFSLILICALGFVFVSAINRIYNQLSYNEKYNFYLKKWFGYEGEPPYTELVMLRVVAQIILVLGLALLFAQLIGETSYFIYSVLDYFFHGFKIAGYTAQPLQWLIGIVSFCLFALLARHVSTKISRSHQFNQGEETQVAVASIALYAGFSIAVIMGLLMAGFSFTSLAIIAGALSVGIGLGLQSIVNNFFSGLILLIEKPIKVGDRIKIDQVEGFVKKVSVRSTQITTPAKEDIIIPNSDLITHQVTNYMFSDKFVRIECKLGVAYGSDLEQVRDVMINVALAHSEVVKSERNKPLVLFRSFGDSALIFELWCMIRDVNKKYVVTSDLNFALDKACREHHISIAFPQRDVHLKFEKPIEIKNEKF